MTEIKATIKPNRLKIEYLTNPVGIDVLKPRLSWLLESEANGLMQCAYRVIVATGRELIDRGIGDMWDSGKVYSGETVNIEYAGARLESRKKYWWKVCSYHDADSPGSFSEAAMFETAFLKQSDFICKWIGADETIASPIFRHTTSKYDSLFSLSKKFL